MASKESKAKQYDEANAKKGIQLSEISPTVNSTDCDSETAVNSIS
mgnify:CR=1 FL=1